ncbi:MAG: AAA family ATPase [Planctomycetota bacterium]|jgi:ABC-type cobalamin/Fe3+-siderophores transport system ATPase subunit
MNPLVEMEIENYKSFTKERVTFEGITCIVGANESGKTNLLSAIAHLSQSNQRVPFQADDLRMGTPGYPRGLVRIAYTLALNESLLGSLHKQFPNALGARLRLGKSGMPGETPAWSAAIDLAQNKLPDILQIKTKARFISAFQGNRNKKALATRRAENGWFFKDSSVDLRRQPFKRLLEKQIIRLVGGQDKVRLAADILKSAVLNNVRVFEWNCEERDFLPGRVNIYNFVQDPNTSKTAASMFRIAGWKSDEFSTNLMNQTDTVYANLFAAVERKIDSIIRNNWSTHKKLTIKLQHKGDYFTILLNEPGSSTPPEYRSDGLKWFLTFLINFRAQSTNIKDYILLVDEPGLHLHPKGQKDTLSELGALNQKHENQVIYTTHQPFLIDKNKPERVRIIERRLDKSRDLAKNPFYASKVSVASDPKSILTDRLLRQALGFKVSDISPINEKNILVEGVFDRDILHIVNDHYGIVDFNDTSILSCGGAPDIAKHASLYTANGLIVVCFYDSDAAGKSAYSRNDKVRRTQKCCIRDYEKRDEYETMEDLVPEATFVKSCKDWFKKWGISDAVPSRPRMKSLARHLRKEPGRELKHSLEDIIVAKVKADLRREEAGFQIISKVIEGLNQRLT